MLPHLLDSRHLVSRGLLLACGLFVLLPDVVAQTPRLIERSPSAFAHAIYVDGQRLATVPMDLSEEARVIVQFTEEPLARLAQNAGHGDWIAARSLIETQHARFHNDLAAIAAAGPNTEAIHPRVEREFTTVLNGVAVSLPRHLLPLVRELDYVYRVDENRRVEAFTGRTGAVHGRRSVVTAQASASSTTGAGIVIAVIDTGVDYTHPALGGGLGSGFKVIGGWDFIGNSADPMDDNGHGTHVAAIAAGDGPGFSGVAPAASILAYKVLDAGGFGDLSDVISAIEAAVDPNGDGLFDDRADIINLSLGGAGDADDPGSVAVDNAVNVGSVVVVAAGNLGGYLTIGSPASTRLGITVGAHDAANAVAPFSSRGPANGSFGLKPDVLAPGVDVTSAWPGGGYQTHSGTSMAAPYVAGVAALLLEQHQGWTPSDVRSALMSTAVTVGEDIYTEGMGRVRASHAAAITFSTTPSFSFGLVGVDQPMWVATLPLEVRNFSGAARVIDLSIDANLPPGVSISVTPASLSLPGNSHGSATVTVTVDNAQVPFAPLVPPTIAGRIVAQSQGEIARTPFSVVKTSYVRVTSDAELSSIWFLGQDHEYWGSFTAPNNGGIVVVPPGTYTVVAPYGRFEGQRFVPVVHVKEAVTVASNTPVNFQASDLVNLVRVAGRTHTGGTADVYMLDYVLTLPGYGINLAVGGNVLGDRLRTSNATDVLLDAAGFANVASGADYVSTHGRQGSITAPLILTPDPAAYRRVDFEYVVPPGISVLRRAPGFVFDFAGEALTSYTWVFENEARFELRAPFRQERYVTEAPPGSPFFGFSEFVIDAASEFWGGLEAALHAAPVFAASGSQTTVYRGGLVSNPAYSTGESPHTVAVGLSPPMWHGRFVRTSPDQLGFDRAASDVFFLDAAYGRPGGLLRYDLYQDGDLAGSGEATNLEVWSLPYLTVGAPARLHMRHEGHRALELGGNATVDLTFDARLADQTPPRLVDLQVRSDGSPTVALPVDALNTLHLTLDDESLVIESMVSVQRLASGAWEHLASLTGPGPHLVTVPHSLRPGYYGLRVMAADAAPGTPGNRMDYQADVAFAYSARALAENGAPTVPQLLGPEHDIVLDPATVASITFSWTSSSDPDGDLLSYALRLHGPGLDTTLTSWDLPEVSLDMTGLLQEQGIYVWSVTTSDGFVVVQSVERRILTPGAVDSEPSGAPTHLALDQNFPNPFGSTTAIRFSLAEAGFARLTVYDVLGRRVANLVADELPAGWHSVEWDAAGVANGTYVYRLEAGATVHARRLVVMR